MEAQVTIINIIFFVVGSVLRLKKPYIQTYFPPPKNVPKISCYRKFHNFSDFLALL